MDATRASDRRDKHAPAGHEEADEPPLLLLAAALGVILAVVGVLTAPALVVIGGLVAAVAVAFATRRPAAPQLASRGATQRQAGGVRRDPTVAWSPFSGSVPPTEDAPRPPARP